MAFALAIEKSFILYKMLRRIIQCTVPCYILYIEKSLVIFQIVFYNFE